MCLWSLQLEIFNTKILSNLKGGPTYLDESRWIYFRVLNHLKHQGPVQSSDLIGSAIPAEGKITPVNCYDFIQLFKYCHFNYKSILVCSWVLCHNNNNNNNNNKWRCLYSTVSLHSSPQQSKNAKRPNMLKQPILNLEMC